jgi:CheY-like chemotaxis protein
MSRLTIIVIDDNPDDRILARVDLEREFPGCRVLEAGDPPEWAALVARGGFDAVVTDYALRWTTGLEVLRQVKALDPHCPVVMFTATGTQEVAVEAMKSGLDDYIVKSPQHFVRLPAAVRRAIDHAAVRRRAHEVEVRLQDLLDRVNVGVYRATLLGELLECNRAFLRLLGHKSREDAAASEGFRQVLWGNGGPGPTSFMREPGEKFSRETTIVRADSDRVVLMVSESTIRFGDHVLVDGVVEDVTALRSPRLGAQAT